jgi:hypothetical protein
MFNFELCVDGEIFRIFTEERLCDVRRLGVCVMRARVNLVRIEANGEWADAASRFSEFYADVSDKFLKFCEENIGKRASEEFALADARMKYRFSRYDCKCGFVPGVVQEEGVYRLEVARNTEICRRAVLLAESRDTLVWELPRLLIKR